MHQSPVRASLNTIEITALFIKRVCQGKPGKLKLNIKIVKKKNRNQYEQILSPLDNSAYRGSAIR